MLRIQEERWSLITFRTLHEKQITYMHTVPSLLYQFFTYLQDNGIKKR